MSSIILVEHETLGRYLVDLLKRQGMTVEALAKAARVERQLLEDVVGDAAKPSADLLKKIASHLPTTLAALRRLATQSAPSPTNFVDYLQGLLDEAAFEGQPMTMYRLAQLSGLTQAHVGKLLRGERNATDDVLEKLAPHLGVSLDELLAHRDVYTLGEEGIERIKKYVPEALGMKPPILAPDLSAPYYPAQAPDEWELAAIARLGAEEDRTIAPKFGGALWHVSKEERRGVLEGLLAEHEQAEREEQLAKKRWEKEQAKKKQEGGQAG